ncbi:hypothetical protein [Acetobacter tropicalis]|uniref:hypothetical protein n=1 Tax=Acetobacter tropicalis TaxID=104102 RepID=UPI0012DFF0F6|nr:hypothetical protein [Acetobacter tropicalis]
MSLKRHTVWLEQVDRNAAPKRAGFAGQPSPLTRPSSPDRPSDFLINQPYLLYSPP